MSGIFSYFFERLCPQKSDLTSNVTNVGRFVAFSAERNRSKVRTIGFYEIAIARNPGRDFLNPLMSVALLGQGGAVLGYMLLTQAMKAFYTRRFGWQ